MQIVDAGMLAFAAWHALKTRVDLPLTFHVPRMVRTIVTEAQDTLVLCWNGEDLTKRKLLPTYRNRKEIWEEAGRHDFDAMMIALSTVGVVQYRTHGVEADEVLAALVHRYDGEEDIVIHSDDKDFFQLLSPTTSMLGRRRGVVRIDDVERIAGVPARAARDLLALEGDRADDIPRVLKPSVAKDVLRRHGPMAEWIDDDDAEISPAIRRLLAEQRAQLDQNLALVDLSRDAVGDPPEPVLDAFGDLEIARALGERTGIGWLQSDDLADDWADVLSWGRKTCKRLGV